MYVFFLLITVLYPPPQPKQEAILLELNLLKDDIQHILARIDDWTKPEKVSQVSGVQVFITGD